MLGQEQMSKEDFLRAEQMFYRELREKRNEVRKFKASLREHEQALELLSDLPKKVSSNLHFVPRSRLTCNMSCVSKSDAA
jgi:hypothetical protein